jgi:DNA-binding response OmpR family regulator
MNRILLIDDDTELTALLSDFLVEEGFLVNVESDGTCAVARALSNEFAIVVLDVMMPQLNGLEVLRLIRQESTLPVLMLTGRGDDLDRITGLELGADDYVAKPCTPRELVARIRAILRRTRLADVSGSLVNYLTSGSLTLWPERRRAEWLNEPLRLTSTEFSVLETLLRHLGHPVSKKDLSEQVLGRPPARYDRIIDVHVSNVRRKLGLLPDGRSPIQAVHRQGYQLVKD